MLVGLYCEILLYLCHIYSSLNYTVRMFIIFFRLLALFTGVHNLTQKDLSLLHFSIFKQNKICRKLGPYKTQGQV